MLNKWVESFWKDPWEPRSGGSVCGKIWMRGIFVVYPEPCYLHLRHMQILSIQINRVSLLKKKTRIQSVHVKIWIWGFSWKNGKQAWPQRAVFLRMTRAAVRWGCPWAQGVQGPYYPTPSGLCGALCCQPRSMLQRNELARCAESGVAQRSFPQGEGVGI